ncbi:type IV pilus assembly protein PilO [Sedimentibacter acidaminivorans]|uniref:Type IV pilus assembly protein PilO n=1 Tax=Sedimentibacter acidaminivorans TaxID=913099 RepID=A0ABS4GHZ5_9FIRM|nr:LysM domain-containing protein [Sedimentibacter acidaminivorans]MBP1927329.1 type IV pilus assembly protein PilO [Sedimentibacter acidaminivorans]
MNKKFQISKINLRPLTKSEKTLLILLGIVLIIYFSNRFVFVPQAEETISLETEIVELDNKIADMNNTIKKEDNIKKEWEMLHREREEILKNYFPVLDQAQIIYLLNDLIVDDRVAISDINFSNPSEETLGEMAVRNMSISLPYSGSYDGTMEIINSLGSSPRRVVVDNLTMDREGDSNLSGNMTLKIYSLEGIAKTDPDVIHVETVDGDREGSLIASYDGYSDAATYGVVQGGAYGSSYGGGKSGSSTAINDNDYVKVYRLDDFETRNYSFIPSNENIKGNAEPSTIKKSGKYSLRFEYNMFAIGQENRAYVDLGPGIELKFPPDTISMWVDAFGYSPGTLGLRFRTQDGEDIDVVASRGISWLGWSEVEAATPQDLDLYPLTLTHIYFEMPFNRDDIGVFLIDKLQAFYPVNEDSQGNNQPIYDFYVVKPGDSVTSISRQIYGTINYKNEILTNNSLTSGDILPVGKVLVLVRR